MEIGALIRKAGLPLVNNAIAHDKDFPSMLPGRSFDLKPGVFVVRRWIGSPPDGGVSQHPAAAWLAEALKAGGASVEEFADRFEPYAPILVLVSGNTK